jgi:DNA polymerase III subunit beta
MTATLTRAGLAFMVDRAAFASAVTWAAKRVSSRPNIPAHGGILLTVADSTLTVAGMNENASATATVGVEGSDGKVLVSGRLLADLLGTLPDKPIAATVEGNSLVLTCARSRSTLPLMPIEDFPTLPEVPQVIGEVDAAVLGQAVKLVGSCCDVNGERSVAALTGINLAFGVPGEADTRRSDVLRIEATAIYRGAYAEIPWRPAGTADVTALPLGSELIAVAADLADEAVVRIGVEDGLLGLATATRSVVIRQLGMPYGASSHKLIHLHLHNLGEPATVKVADLKQPLERIRLMGAPKDVPMAVFSFERESIRVRGSGQDATAADEVSYSYPGESAELTMNARYLLAALAAANGDQVHLHFGTYRQPFVLTPTKGAFEYRQFVAPLRPAS